MIAVVRERTEILKTLILLHTGSGRRGRYRADSAHKEGYRKRKKKNDTVDLFSNYFFEINVYNKIIVSFFVYSCFAGHRASKYGGRLLLVRGSFFKISNFVDFFDGRIGKSFKIRAF